MEYIGFNRLGKVIAEKQKAFTNTMKDMEEFSYRDFCMCVKRLVFRKTRISKIDKDNMRKHFDFDLLD